MHILYYIWDMLNAMAPYLLLGYVFAGILSVLISKEWVERHLGGEGVKPVIMSALLGMPLPLCSCSVIPVMASLKKHGASNAASASFVVSTPTTGVDSILAAWSLMGPVFAIYRAVMSVLIGFFSGALVLLTGANGKDKNALSEQSSGSCCEAHAHSDGSRLLKAAKHAFITLPADLFKPLMIGILISALISWGAAEYDLRNVLGGGIITMLILLAASVPMYICATASIPLALGLIHLGASPGAALVFIVAGPATNAATLGVLWTSIGKKATIAVLVSIVTGALGGGLLLDYVWTFMDLAPMSSMVHEHSEGYGWFSGALAVIFVAVHLYSYYVSRNKKKNAMISDPPAVIDADQNDGKKECHSSASSCCKCSGK